MNPTKGAPMTTTKTIPTPHPLYLYVIEYITKTPHGKKLRRTPKNILINATSQAHANQQLQRRRIHEATVAPYQGKTA